MYAIGSTSAKSSGSQQICARLSLRDACLPPLSSALRGRRRRDRQERWRERLDCVSDQATLRGRQFGAGAERRARVPERSANSPARKKPCWWRPPVPAPQRAVPAGRSSCWQATARVPLHPKARKLAQHARDRNRRPARPVPGSDLMSPSDPEAAIGGRSRFPRRMGWGTFDYDAASNTFKPVTAASNHRRKTTRSAGSLATPWCRTTCTRNTVRCE
jgi:hypothetical protein